jgi:hypothetical protein
MKKIITIAGIGATMLLMTGEVMAEKEGEVNRVADQETTYEKDVLPFLSTYCTSCHDDTKSKGDVTLHDISGDLAAGKDIDLWNTVLKQLELSEMPPAKAKNQPTASEIEKVVGWINAELNKSGNVAKLYHQLESPNFGNLVNHEKLFSGEIKTKPFSPARLWRVSEKVFDNVKSELLGICFLREAPERAIGTDRRAGKWGLDWNDYRDGFDFNNDAFIDQKIDSISLFVQVLSFVENLGRNLTP